MSADLKLAIGFFLAALAFIVVVALLDGCEDTVNNYYNYHKEAAKDDVWIPPEPDLSAEETETKPPCVSPWPEGTSFRCIEGNGESLYFYINHCEMSYSDGWYQGDCELDCFDFDYPGTYQVLEKVAIEYFTVICHQEDPDEKWKPGCDPVWQDGTQVFCCGWGKGCDWVDIFGCKLVWDKSACTAACVMCWDNGCFVGPQYAYFVNTTPKDLTDKYDCTLIPPEH